ncbi:three component ABC system middle component [Achromobacter sp. JUb104]|uniref:three component ABC system middle component n=1 Tax=Achromobacter sp. JUb104 TaxID=2940590 RepID=UPI00216A71FE|nr:three component ABC system middle component [Achromobacter sp. JUb104]MCS3505413.1 hypothetical protein [Achromobacter sp. JUb104]
MNRLSQNELLGVVGIQSALEHAEGGRLSLGKIMLILPLIFDKATRSVLKNRRSVVLGSRDLLMSNPVGFSTVRGRFEDLTITSLNSIVLAQELGLAKLDDDALILRKCIFSRDSTEIGKIAVDILECGPKLGHILQEDGADLYQTFRIAL